MSFKLFQLCAALKENKHPIKLLESFHTYTCSRLHGISPVSLTSEWRNRVDNKQIYAKFRILKLPVLNSKCNNYIKLLLKINYVSENNSSLFLFIFNFIFGMDMNNWSMSSHPQMQCIKKVYFDFTLCII